MNLGEVHTEIRSAIGRGTSLDTSIVSYCKQAARWLEANFDWKYMEKSREFNLDADAPNARLLAFPNSRVKSTEYVRLVIDEEYFYLNSISPKDVTGIAADRPVGYYLDGHNYMVLDCNPKEDYLLEASFLEYTDWPTDLTSETWLTVNAWELLLFQTLCMLAPRLRDARLYQMHKELRDQSLKVHEDAIYNFNYSNSSMQMVYK